MRTWRGLGLAFANGMFARSHRVVVSLLFAIPACGGQTNGNVASTSPGAGGMSSAGGSSAGSTTGTAGSTGTAGYSGNTAVGGSNSGASGGGTATGGQAGKNGGTGGGIQACCTADLACGAGVHECVNGNCLAPVTPLCWRDADCPTGQKCEGALVCPCGGGCQAIPSPGTCTGSGGSGGAGGSNACASAVEGEPCAPTGLSCAGAACCGPFLVCQSSKWQLVISTCPMPKPCPASPPVDGSSCCGGFPAACAWDECTTVGYVSATCSFATGKWTVSTDGCDTGASCDGKTCNPGEVCVEHQGGAGISYTCTPDPCGAAPLSCDCAGTICGGPPMGCSVTDPQHVTCTCNLCP